MTKISRVTAIGLLAAGTLCAEAVYSPHKYQQNDWFWPNSPNQSFCWYLWGL